MKNIRNKSSLCLDYSNDQPVDKKELAIIPSYTNFNKIVGKSDNSSLDDNILNDLIEYSKKIQRKYRNYLLKGEMNKNQPAAVSYGSPTSTKTITDENVGKETAAEFTPLRDDRMISLYVKEIVNKYFQTEIKHQPVKMEVQRTNENKPKQPLIKNVQTREVGVECNMMPENSGRSADDNKKCDKVSQEKKEQKKSTILTKMKTVREAVIKQPQIVDKILNKKRIIGKLSKSKLDMTSVYPRWEMEECETLFPRRVAKIVETKPTQTIDNHAPAVMNDSWHKLLESKKNMGKSKKIVRFKYDPINEKTDEIAKDVPLVIHEVNRNSQKALTEILPEVSIQKLPPINIRAECRIQNNPGISIEPTNDNKNRYQFNRNVSYFQFVCNSPQKTSRNIVRGEIDRNGASPSSTINKKDFLVIEADIQLSKAETDELESNENSKYQTDVTKYHNQPPSKPAEVNDKKTSKSFSLCDDNHDNGIGNSNDNNNHDDDDGQGGGWSKAQQEEYNRRDEFNRTTNKYIAPFVASSVSSKGNKSKMTSDCESKSGDDYESTFENISFSSTSSSSVHQQSDSSSLTDDDKLKVNKLIGNQMKEIGEDKLRNTKNDTIFFESEVDKSALKYFQKISEILESVFDDSKDENGEDEILKVRTHDQSPNEMPDLNFSKQSVTVQTEIFNEEPKIDVSIKSSLPRTTDDINKVMELIKKDVGTYPSLFEGESNSFPSKVRTELEKKKRMIFKFSCPVEINDVAVKKDSVTEVVHCNTSCQTDQAIMPKATTIDPHLSSKSHCCFCLIGHHMVENKCCCFSCKNIQPAAVARPMSDKLSPEPSISARHNDSISNISSKYSSLIKGRYQSSIKDGRQKNSQPSNREHVKFNHKEFQRNVLENSPRFQKTIKSIYTSSSQGSFKSPSVRSKSDPVVRRAVNEFLQKMNRRIQSKSRPQHVESDLLSSDFSSLDETYLRHPYDQIFIPNIDDCPQQEDSKNHISNISSDFLSPTLSEDEENSLGDDVHYGQSGNLSEAEILSLGEIRLNIDIDC